MTDANGASVPDELAALRAVKIDERQAAWRATVRMLRELRAAGATYEEARCILEAVLSSVMGRNEE